ncbi:MAG: GTPase-activating protein [Chaenotheca gracillima]|nr:MAG: GTPase-activating protein [Chaenotheca gracillima]
MGRIKKTGGPKHEASLSPGLADFVNTSITIPLLQLPDYISTGLPARWSFPRGDLYHWIPLLNRFDHVLELFVREYQLDEGPQTKPFGRQVLLRGDNEKSDGSGTATDDMLDACRFSEEGDRELVESILGFSRRLLENCGNRSLYASSNRLNDLLNTSSLSLLNCTLRLGVRLAQRYHASRVRTMSGAQHVNSSLLANHYNINLDRVQRIAAPFIKSVPAGDAPTASLGSKGKEKASSTNRTGTGLNVLATDLVSIATDTPNVDNVSTSHEKRSPVAGDIGWEDWGNISFTYYPTSPTSTADAKPTAPPTISSPDPQTPTPSRRTSGLGPHSAKKSRLSMTDEQVQAQSEASPTKKPDPESGGIKTVEIPFAKLSSTGPVQILSSMLPEVPQENRFDLLHRLRVASALTESVNSRRDILAIRILAITNLAYIYPELTFQQKVLQQDSDEPRRLQLAYQLAELVNAPTDGPSSVPRTLQSVALGGLEALAKQKAKAGEVCAALGVNVSHGIILHAVRRAVAMMSTDTPEQNELEEDEWREALFSLLAYLPSTARTGEALVSAGLMPPLLEVLTLRTEKAIRTHHKILNFLDTFVYGVRDAFQTLANARGLDILSELTAWAVNSASDNVEDPEARKKFRTPAVDYDLDFYHQQTLRSLFKFINHMLSHSTGNFDRLLRNLIDSPPLLGGLRSVISNPKTYGSTVWSGAVNILTSFINNEPTSYAVIAEAGLSDCLLEAVTNGRSALKGKGTEGFGTFTQIVEDLLAVGSPTENEQDGTAPQAESTENGEAVQTEPRKDPYLITYPKEPLAEGILPATEAIVTVPQAFGAICLNTAGMKSFQESHALESFFEIFFSPKHVECMENELELPNMLGSSFDELVRHHPPLRKSVMGAVLTMVIAMGQLCRSRAESEGTGAKLWVEGDNGQILVAGGRSSLKGNTSKLEAPQPDSSGDVQMSGADDSIPEQGPPDSDSPVTIEELEAKESSNSPSVSAYIDVVARFLGGYFANGPLCTSFIEQGGAEWLLDLAMLPCLTHDFNSSSASQNLSRVIHHVVEQKPHLVLPSLVKRAQAAANDLRPFFEHNGTGAFFEPLVSTVAQDGTYDEAQLGIRTNGTLFVKSLVTLHTLSNILGEVFAQHVMTHRAGSSIFNQVNLGDMYINAITSVASIQRACIWESLKLRRAVPESWGTAFTKDFNHAIREITGILDSLPQQNGLSNGTTENGAAQSGEASGSTNGPAEQTQDSAQKAVEEDSKTASFKNFKVLQYLMHSLPLSITPFLQGVGRYLIPKRQSDNFQKQNALMVADAMAEAGIDQLNFVPGSETASKLDRYHYLLAIVKSLSQLMIEGPLERPQCHTLTLILQAFKNKGGFDVLKRVLLDFFEEIKAQDPKQDKDSKSLEEKTSFNCAQDGMKMILTFYSQVVLARNILDASQTAAITSRERDRDKPDYFLPSQFVVELRMTVLPVAQILWDSDALDSASSTIVKKLIDVLRISLEADNESGAFRRTDRIPNKNKGPPKTFTERQEYVDRLVTAGYDRSLVSEALYRCNNHPASAEDYCNLIKSSRRATRNPVPSQLKPSSSPSGSAPALGGDQTAAGASEPTQASMAPPTAANGQSVILENLPQIDIEQPPREEPEDEAMALPIAPGIPFDEDGPAGTQGFAPAMALDHILENLPGSGRLPGRPLEVNDGEDSSSQRPSISPESGTEAGKLANVITYDDLEETRLVIRRNLIVRSLDILNAHSDVTFELADLITTAVLKTDDPESMRKEIGETLVQSLLSLQLDDDEMTPEAGKKIAGYAHLLGLVLQDRQFYAATLAELKENFPGLLAFVKLVPGRSLEESSPWIGEVLLTVEKLLAEDSQPRQVNFTPPPKDGPAPPPGSPIAELEDPVIPADQKAQLFDAIVEVLPHVGKNSGLALSITRTLVILTRDRTLASKLGERRNLQRLFVMMKQIAALTTVNLSSSFFLILRHIVEDEATVRQIMQHDIKGYFQSRQAIRPPDTGSFVTTFSSLVLRDPEIFVEVCNDLLKLTRFDHNQRNQSLTLKQSDDSEVKDVATSFDESVNLDEKPTAEVDEPVKPTTEPLETPGKGKGIMATETKTPVIEHPDGVIDYLLRELLSYKDVEDKESSPPSKEFKHESGAAGPSDVEMEDASTPSLPNETSTQQDEKKPEKPEFKGENHPIFVYRCFIMHCLTELLLCYNRTKIEFINFSRKTPPQPMTPTKPRSGVLNYLLNELIPVGTLTHPEDIMFRKKQSTSIWAISVVVALCAKTAEIGNPKPGSKEEVEPDLVFVRKFVLEHALKAYKDATGSAEPLDSKYARMMSLGDLFDHLLLGRINGSATINPDMYYLTPRQLSRIMYEKNFIAALTSSIADIDLNFPFARRAIKYILRPLKLLTQTAIELSESSSVPTTPGQSGEEEISSATSVSEMDEDREETPDLFRNSTLGMFEPGREDESSSGNSDDDEEMYDDEYGDEMEYDEEMQDDEDEVISDEDEELGHVEGLDGDVGLDVEVVLNGPEDDGDDGSESDTDDSDEMDDGEDDEHQFVDEITGDDENASLGGDADEWQSEEDGDEAEYDEGDEIGHGHEGHHDPLDHIMHALEGDDGQDMLQHLQGGELNMDMDPEAYMEDDVQDDDDISEDDEDEDEMDDEEVIYEAGFDDDEGGLPWGWEGDGDQPVLHRGHHHHHQHHRPGRGPWSILAGGPREPGTIIPTYRPHRPATDNRVPGPDDGSNPLLQRTTAPAPTGRSARHDDWMQAIETASGGRGLIQSDNPTSFINNLINVVGQGGPGLGGVHQHGGALHFHIGGGPPGSIPREVQALLGMRPTPGESSRTPRDDPASAVSFTSASTAVRWQEEARLLFRQEVSKKAQQVINSLLTVMVPLAREEEAERKEKAAQAAKKIKEEQEKHVEEERVAKEKAEQEKKEQKEAEERDAAEKAANGTEIPSENQEAEQTTAEADVPEATDQPQDEQAMEGVETTPTEAAPVEPSAASGEAEASTAPASRVRTVIRGRELDITGMDIDPDYLDALPEELREEVLMHQIAERRSQAATAGEAPTDINREFLEALPDDIRDELLEQEAQDRRRREREESRRRAPPATGATQAPTAEDMDPASMLATLDPGLRQAILMEQDEDVLAQLPQALAAEARALGGEHRLRHFIDPQRVNRNRGGHDQDDQQAETSSKKPPKKTIVQMLDKAGVATLLRLMFIPQQGSARHTLNSILQNICENRQNRAEVVSLLLSILQDGSADLNAVERSFAHLSLRARQAGLQKTPQTPKRASTDPLSQINSESSPLMVVQQCLSSLFLLVQYNPHVPWFFLTEHDTTISLKKGGNRKGKAKETKALKFAVNSLLGLLDRKLIMESSTVMEQLSALLSRVTHPLTLFLRKGNDKNSTDTDKEMTDDGPEPSERAVSESVTGTINTSTGQDESVTVQAGSEEEQPAETAPETADEPGTQTAAGESAEDSEKKDTEEKAPKKQRDLPPPVIPEHNLRLVVSILAARECSARTFRDTLSTINNLSTIPSAKEVFGQELLKQAQDLGRSILDDLNDLISQIQKAQTGTDIEGVALAKFSPASSDQAKLLRVLTALDYLFDTKKNDDKSPIVKPGGEEVDENAKEKQDVLAALYEDSTSGPLWHKLSECLSAIRQREGMLTVATILLPLIEALMVVCKNTTLKSTPTSLAQAKEFAAASPAPEAPTASLERLFFNFTEEHRKILNDLVRQNPKLMSGTFSLLVKNPKVLEFDNKRNYFTRRLHSRGTERHSQPPLQLSVRRDQVFLDSFKSLYFKSGDEMKYGKLGIRFHGEEGVDAGGVTREWFQVLSRQMFNPDYALFTPVASDRTTFHPNRLSAVNPEHFMFFKFIGRIIGKALYEGRVLDCHFSRAVYKKILGKPVSVKDMETLDLDYYKSLVWMLENDITDIITETFSVENEAFGESVTIDLKENGRNIPVTEENKQDYVRLVVEYRLTGSVQDQLEHFLKGFHDIVPAELVSIFNEQELELLISGLPDIDVDDWKNNTEYHNYSASSAQIQWFWRAVRSFDKEERAKLLQFVTGTSKVPLNGFKELEGMNGFSRFNIHRDYGNKDRLPSSHTCFNQLDLPEYDSYEALRQQTYTAMTAGSEYFGFA